MLTPAQRALARAIVRAIVREETERASQAAEGSGERRRLHLIERATPARDDEAPMDDGAEPCRS